jgi:hypothetical protein
MIRLFKVLRDACAAMVRETVTGSAAAATLHAAPATRKTPKVRRVREKIWRVFMGPSPRLKGDPTKKK